MYNYKGSAGNICRISPVNVVVICGTSIYILNVRSGAFHQCNISVCKLVHCCTHSKSEVMTKVTGTVRPTLEGLVSQ